MDDEVLGVGDKSAAVVVIVKPTEKRQENVEQTPRDGGLRAWLVCLMSCWTNGALFGVINNAGVMYAYLKETFGSEGIDDSFKISLVGSLCVGFTFLLSPVAAILTDLFGIRKISFVGAILVLIGIALSSFVNSLEMLYLSFGILFGAGASLAYTPSLVVLGHYFKRRLSLVNGIVAAGSSISTMVLPFFLEYMLVSAGLSVTFQVLVILMAPLLASLFIYKPVLNSRRTEKAKMTEFLGCSIWLNKKYLVWAFSFPVCLFGYFVPYVHLVKHTHDILPGYNAKFLIFCMGGASLVGRLVFGIVADVPGISRILLQQISFFSIGVLTMLLSVANDYWILIVICLGMGLFDGCFITLLGPIAFDIVGTKKASQAIGFLLGLCSVPLTLGPPIAGWMYDHLGKNYQLAFVAAGVPPVIGAILMFGIRLVKQNPSEVQSQMEAKEMVVMLNSSATKESKIDDEGQGDDGVWTRIPESKEEDGTAVKLLGMKTTGDLDISQSELIEKHSTC